MELNNLQVLIERAWALQDDIGDSIQNSGTSCCWRHCSEHDHQWAVTDAPLDERKRLIVIRDSLKNVENRLEFLQRLNSWQQKDQQAALVKLEESRLILMDKVAQYQGRPTEVLKELNAYFGDAQTACNWNLKRMIQRMTEPTVQKGSSRSNNPFVQAIRRLLDPWTWHKTAIVAVKLILVPASITYTFRSYRNMLKYDSSPPKVVSFVDSTVAADTRKSFDVFRGRG